MPSSPPPRPGPSGGVLAFADESFREAPGGAGYYIVAAAVFEPHALDEARDTLRTLHGGRVGKLHWTQMKPVDQLRVARELAKLEALHLVTVGAPVPERKQDRARARCLRTLVFELHGYGVTHLVMESRTRQLNARDVDTVKASRFDLPKGTTFRIEHIRGGAEPALWAADVVAGAVRANHEGRAAYRALLEHRIYEVVVDVDC